MFDLSALSLSAVAVAVEVVVAVAELAVEALVVLVVPPSPAQLQRLCSLVLSSPPDVTKGFIYCLYKHLSPDLAAIPVDPLYGDPAPQVFLEPAVEGDALPDVVDHGEQLEEGCERWPTIFRHAHLSKGWVK